MLFTLLIHLCNSKGEHQTSEQEEQGAPPSRIDPLPTHCLEVLIRLLASEAHPMESLGPAMEDRVT